MENNELWNREIEEAKIKFNWTDEEMAVIYRIVAEVKGYTQKIRHNNGKIYYYPRNFF